jgi:hypothetical protein
METIECTTTKMDKMGERPVQEGIGKIPENEVQRTPPIIRTLEIGISVNKNIFKVIY